MKQRIRNIGAFNNGIDRTQMTNVLQLLHPDSAPQIIKNKLKSLDKDNDGKYSAKEISEEVPLELTGEAMQRYEKLVRCLENNNSINYCTLQNQN